MECSKSAHFFCIALIYYDAKILSIYSQYAEWPYSRICTSSILILLGWVVKIMPILVLLHHYTDYSPKNPMKKYQRRYTPNTTRIRFVFLTEKTVLYDIKQVIATNRLTAKITRNLNLLVVIISSPWHTRNESVMAHEKWVGKLTQENLCVMN